MKARARIFRHFVRGVLGIVCDIDDEEIKKVPRRGPLIVVTNHVSFLEVPMLYCVLFPRELKSLVKRETWKNLPLRILANAWDAIPLDRGSTDMSAMRSADAALEKGALLAIAPEGTRSGNGKLQRAKQGIVPLALRSGARIIPVAHFGGEVFWKRFSRGKRTKFTFRVGEPFRLRPPGPGESKRARQELADAIMNRISILLPEEYRGEYPNPEKASFERLDFGGNRIGNE